MGPLEEVNGLQLSHQQNEEHLEILQNRIAELTEKDQPNALSVDWLEQIKTLGAVS